MIIDWGWFRWDLTGLPTYFLLFMSLWCGVRAYYLLCMKTFPVFGGKNNPMRDQLADLQKRVAELEAAAGNDSTDSES